VRTENGLSERLPGAGLPSYLDRGPTPEGASYTVTRIPVGIAGATAGADADKASLSYDDNEVTGWKNDGQVATGWITYTLEREALISEVTMKLSGWRNRSYPIQILVDNKVVFQGNTERTLGYVTMPVVPTRGKKVTVKLIGTSLDRDAFGAVVELAGHIEGASAQPARGSATSELNILEIELYEPAK